jgi:hypothetical protein
MRTLRIKNEIKFLYKNKQLNKELYTLHLLTANEWGNTIITVKITDTMKHKHYSINRKIQNLTNEQRKDTQPINNTYKRVENLTNITFTNDETKLLRQRTKMQSAPQTQQLDQDTNNRSRYSNKSAKHNRTSIHETSSSQQATNTNKTRKKQERDRKLIKNIKKKMELNNLIAREADKGKTLIIMNRDE